MEKTRFGALLKRYRKAAELSQEALAGRAGLSTRAISDLERGINRAPRHATLELLAGALKLSPQQRDLLKIAAYPDIGIPPGGNIHTIQPGIPLPPTRLIGREAECLQLVGWLRSRKVRLLTITGPSGVGKTRLALELALALTPDFADGCVYIPLASVRDASIVPGTIAQFLRIRETHSVSTQDQVNASLQGKHILLLLDNLEQILDCSPFIADLLSNCPHLTILTTSRAPLRLRAEQEFSLAPLPLKDAIALFVERAQAVQPGRTFPTEEVSSICYQLDCLPLAIELAAMQGRFFSLTELQKRLSHKFALLRGGARDLPPRQKTMKDAIAWSYELLPPSQQQFFRALGVFVDSWTLEAAEAVCGSEGEQNTEDRFNVLAALIEASLVYPETDAGEVRFSMLSLIQGYALDRLQAAGEEEQARRAHATYYASLAENAKSLFELGPAEPNLSLTKEIPNVQAALQWAEAHHEAEIGLRLLGFGRLWDLIGQPSQIERWFERMLALDRKAREDGSPAAPLSLRIEKLYGLGRTLLSRGQSERAKTAAMEALHLSQQIGDEKGMTNAWSTLGLIAQASGELDEAETAFNQSAQHAGLVKDEQLQYRALIHLGELARERGDLTRSAGLLEEALHVAQNQKIGWDIAIVSTLLAHLARQQRDFPLAKTRYAESLKRLRLFSNPTFIAWCLEGCATIICEEEHTRSATRLCAAAANLRKQAGTPLPQKELQAFEQVLEKARLILGQGEFSQEWNHGLALTQDEVIEIALVKLA